MPDQCATQELFKKRWSLRVTVCGKRTKRSEQVKSAAAASSGKHLKSGDIGGVAAVPGGESAASRRQQPADKGKQQGETSKKRKLDNVDFAAKRIKLKVFELCYCLLHQLVALD